jgi:hypothetical protein
LISASTCAAAEPSGDAVGLAEAVADVVGRALDVAVAGVSGRGDGEPADADADDDGDDGADPAPAGRDGTVTTVGEPATARPPGLPLQAPVAVEPHPAAVGRVLPAACPDTGPAENAPRAR